VGSARARARLLGCEKHELEGGSESTLLDEFLKQLPFSLSLSLFLSLSLSTSFSFSSYPSILHLSL